LRYTTVLAAFAFCTLLFYDSYGILESTMVLNSGGSIFVPAAQYVRPFGFRIADMMVDILSPNFDEEEASSNWQAALDDLAAASPNGEITHVQLRIFWKVDPTNRSTWEYPTLGSNDPTQQTVMNNWQRWLFGKEDPSLAYGPSAAQRIRQAGFKLELCLSTCWNPGIGTLADATPVWHSGGREADYNFDGELFLNNYLNNVLLPVLISPRHILRMAISSCLALKWFTPLLTSLGLTTKSGFQLLMPSEARLGRRAKA